MNNLRRDPFFRCSSGLRERARISLVSLLLACVPVAVPISKGADNRAVSPSATTIRTLDIRSLPGDAFVHSRSKWSRDEFILVDDDASAPSLYVFDRTDRKKFDSLIQIAGASRVRLLDYAAAPDGSVWACGRAYSATGQGSYFLAHLTDDGRQAQMIRTNPYTARYLAVAPDGSVWTMGYSLGSNGKVDSL